MQNDAALLPRPLVYSPPVLLPDQPLRALGEDLELVLGTAAHGVEDAGNEVEGHVLAEEVDEGTVDGGALLRVGGEPRRFEQLVGARVGDLIAEAQLITNWEALPADSRLALTPPAQTASEAAPPASLFDAPDLSPAEKRVLATLRADESTHIDQLVERLGSHLSASEIFTALFELELSSRIRQLPGKYYVRSM